MRRRVPVQTSPCNNNNLTWHHLSLKAVSGLQLPSSGRVPQTKRPCPYLRVFLIVKMILTKLRLHDEGIGLLMVNPIRVKE